MTIRNNFFRASGDSYAYANNLFKLLFDATRLIAKIRFCNAFGLHARSLFPVLLVKSDTMHVED